jgi:hypothetical protein
MTAFKACTHIYDVVMERWPEMTAEISVVHTTVKLTFPDSVTLTLRPVRTMTSKYDKVSFMFGDIEKIISFDWRNKDGKLFTCSCNPQITIDPLRFGRARHSFECSGSHCQFDPNALISVRRNQPHRVCAIDSSTLHLHYYPHELEDMCTIIDAVFRCRDNTDYQYRAPIRSVSAPRPVRPPKGHAMPPASDDWRKKWVRR